MINLIDTCFSLTRLQKRLIIRGGIVSGVLILFAAFLIFPRHLENEQAQQYLDQLSDKNLSVQETLATTQDFGAKLHQILETLRHYKAMIPPQKMLSGILNDIGSRAQKNKLEVLSLQAVDERPFTTGKTQAVVEIKGREIVEVGIEMSIRGVFNKIGRYITDLEKAPYAILIKEVTLKRESAQSSIGRNQIKLKADIKLVVLMKKSVPEMKER